MHLFSPAWARAAVDERGFEAVRRIREKYTDITLTQFKAIVREQFYMLLLDTEGGAFRHSIDAACRT